MPNINEDRHGGRPSRIMSLGGDTLEVALTEPTFQSLQAAHIAARFVVGDALARAVAELAFAKGRPR